MKERLKTAFFRYLPDGKTIGRAFLLCFPSLVILLGGRYWICHDLKKGMWKQFFLTTLGELELIAGTAIVIAFLLQFLVDKKNLRRIALAIIAPLLTGYMMLNSVDVGFFLLTGARLDLDSIFVFIQELETVWPVVRSEVGGLHLLALVLMLLSMLGASWVRIPLNKVHWSIRIGFLLLYPAARITYVSTPLPKSSLRGLERSLSSLLIEEYSILLQESPLPSSPEEIIPIQVEEKDPQKEKPNIIIFILESTGLKHTSLGSKLETTPNLKRIADEGLWVKDANAIVPHTTKALINILCGDWPQLQTAVPEAEPGGLTQSCLPNLLESVGYQTAFFQPARQTFENRLGLVHAMGFDFFRAKESLNSRRFEKSNYFGLDDQAMIAPSLKWLKKTEKPFFITYLSLASHHKYTLPSKVKPKYSSKKERYKHLSTVHYVDQVLGNLLEELEKEKLMENTLLIVLGDHGEAMGEHGRKQHDLILWQEGLSIPMVLYGPDVLSKTGVIDGLRQQLDILPTVLDIADLKVTQGSPKGTSLLDSVPEDRKTYHACWRERRCLGMRIGKHKFIDHYDRKKWQYYDLSTDPKEKKNLADQQDPQKLKEYREELRTWKRREKGRYNLLLEEWKTTATSQKSTEEALGTWDGISLLGCQLQGKEVFRNETPWIKCSWRAASPIQEMRKVKFRMTYWGKKYKYQTWKPMSNVLPVYRWPIDQKIEDEIPLKIPRGYRGSLKIDVSWIDSKDRTIANESGEEWIRALEFKIK